MHGILSENRVERRIGGRAKIPSLLAGLLHDDKGDPMTPSHAVKNGKRYRYYVTRTLTFQHREAVPDGRRVPADDIEQIVVSRLREFLSSAAEIHEAVAPHAQSAIAQKSLLARAAALSDLWAKQSPAQIRGLRGGDRGSVGRRRMKAVFAEGAIDAEACIFGTPCRR